MEERIVLLGAGGQLGRTLLESKLSELGELTALTRSELDIADEAAVKKALDRLQPAVVINAAAYTAVDAAEENEHAAREANATGPKNLASWIVANGAYLIHFSTDFVFNGRKSSPYTPEDQPDPLGIYGRTKLEGELHVRYLAPDNSLVLRTSWVYSLHGRNFLQTMLRLMREKDSLCVVDDQIGTPTSTESLGQCVLTALQKRPTGLYHWSDAGVASWYDFAVAIQEEALAAGLLERAIPIDPIPGRDYPTLARRPSYSVLDKTRTTTELGYHPSHWRQSLRNTLT